MRHFGFLALTFIVGAAIWLTLAVFLPSSGQRSIFFLDGKYPLWDHKNFRRIVETEQPYLANAGVLREDGAEIIRQDVCYPALAILFVKAAPETTLGAWMFVVLGGVFYLGAAIVFVRKWCDVSPPIVICLLACSAPLLFAVQVGNMITYAAAAALMFLTWYDDESCVKRRWAAFFLALAGVLKVVPVLLGMMYLGKGWKRNLPMIVLAALLFVGLLTVPFLWNGGMSAFMAWLENAAANSAAYADRNGFGVYGIVGSWLRMLGYLHETPTWVMVSARRISVAVAVFCLTYGGGCCPDRLRRMILVIAGMLFLPPTMMIYGSLYLLPVLLVGASRLEGRLASAAKFAFFALALPLQIPLLLDHANVCFASVAVVDLALMVAFADIKETFGNAE